MSDLTPQEIRDRLARVENLLADIAPDGTQAPLQLAVDLCVANATVLNAAALTLLVEEQQQANRIATAQVYATMGPSMFSQARVILDA
jgi:hypothetical protein